MMPSETAGDPMRAGSTSPQHRRHEHAWGVESAHRTSEGRVLYVRCTGCPARRVDRQWAAQQPPEALSAVVMRRGPSSPARNVPVPARRPDLLKPVDC